VLGFPQVHHQDFYSSEVVQIAGPGPRLPEFAAREGEAASKEYACDTFVDSQEGTPLLATEQLDVATD
jgi:hypothetical protein